MLAATDEMTKERKPAGEREESRGRLGPPPAGALHYARRLELPVPAAALFGWHERAGAFERLAPPWERMRVVRREGGIRDGDELVIGLMQGPIELSWLARHEGFVAGREFSDRAMSGPFAYWLHRHAVEPIGPERSALDDQIHYRLPLGWLGALVAGRSIRAMLERMFSFRHRRTARDLRRHHERGQAVPDGELREVAVAGGGWLAEHARAYLGGAGWTLGEPADGRPLVDLRPLDGAPGEPLPGELRLAVAPHGQPIAAAAPTTLRSAVILPGRHADLGALPTRAGEPLRWIAADDLLELIARALLSEPLGELGAWHPQPIEPAAWRQALRPLGWLGRWRAGWRRAPWPTVTRLPEALPDSAWPLLRGVAGELAYDDVATALEEQLG